MLVSGLATLTQEYGHREASIRFESHFLILIKEVPLTEHGNLRMRIDSDGFFGISNFR